MLEFRTLRPEELEQWFDHCMYVFNGETYSEGFRKYFMNHWFNDPWRDYDSILVAAENDKILSTVRIFHRKMNLQGQIISMGGIGEVSTEPGSRGFGLSTKLLCMALNRMKELEMKISILLAGDDKLSYYGSLGWHSLPRIFKLAVVRAAAHDDLRIRPVDFDSDISNIRSIYEQYSSKRFGTIVRDDEFYWEHWMKTEYKNCIISEKDGEAAAYMEFQINDCKINVREFGAITGSEGQFDAMLEAALEASGLKEAEVKFPASIESKSVAERYLVEKGEMINIITPFFIGNKKIEAAEQLLELINSGSPGEGCFDNTFWDTDGF